MTNNEILAELLYNAGIDPIVDINNFNSKEDFIEALRNEYEEDGLGEFFDRTMKEIRTDASGNLNESGQTYGDLLNELSF